MKAPRGVETRLQLSLDGSAFGVALKSFLRRASDFASACRLSLLTGCMLRVLAAASTPADRLCVVARDLRLSASLRRLSLHRVADREGAAGVASMGRIAPFSASSFHVPSARWAYALLSDAALAVRDRPDTA